MRAALSHHKSFVHRRGLWLNLRVPSEPKLPISVCIIAGNEAARIRRMLDSVAGWTAEIVVVLNEDVADGTDQIAAEYGAKVFREPWKGFLAQKNSAADKCTQPWLLNLDADEEVSPELKSDIVGFFSSEPAQFGGASFPRKVWFLGRWITHGDWYPDRVLRLYRAGQGRWAGAAEHCAVKLIGDCKKLRGDLLHYTNPTIASYVGKINYYADIYLQRQLAEDRRWAALPAVLRSAWRFVRAYFFRRGFLDGYPGFFIAASTAYATLVRHSRLYEHLHSQPPPCQNPKSR
jgi:glycosyltransferase involved in cell wall biosynthesis